jgi:SAM-dependent methyltransferase
MSNVTALSVRQNERFRSPQEPRIYSNSGNASLIDLLKQGPARVLDIGCGAGDNAALLKIRCQDTKVFGVTHNPAEAILARSHMQHCWVFDIDTELPDDLKGERFDALIFSHVLEHLRDPARALVRFTALLRTGGIVLIAVPNVLSWLQRIRFLFGKFEYEASGVLDDTHIRFFTFFTADKYLLAQSPELRIQFKGVTGSVPLWWLRRWILPRAWARTLDQWGCRHWPNLFGGQILIKATKT